MAFSSYYYYVLLLIAMTSTTPTSVRCQTYEDTQKIFDQVLGKSRYNADVRPVLNQSHPVIIYVSFEILSIVEVNDIQQSFICNGLFQTEWHDQRGMWNVSDYGGISLIHPTPKQIWRPRMVLVNTLGLRDLFVDDYSPINLWYDGTTMWFPGSLFPTSCKLDLTKYPFDEQTCFIRMFPMSLQAHELTFATESVVTTSYTVNGVWEIKSHSIANGTVSVGGGGILSYFEVTFHLRRRPMFFLLNVLLPVVLLSFLNIMVFVIPVDSGEKISYGITVSLALAVFMSIVSSLLPQASDTIPHVIVYLFALLVISLLTVVVSIIIVFLHHMEGKEESSMKAKRKFRSAISTVTLQNRVVSPMMSGGFDSRRTSMHDPLGADDRNDRSIQTVDSLLSRPPRVKFNNNNNHHHHQHHHQAKRPSWVDVMADEEDETKDDNGNDYNNRNEDSDRKNKYKIIGNHIDVVSFVVFTVIWAILTLWVFIQIAA